MQSIALLALAVAAVYAESVEHNEPHAMTLPEHCAHAMDDPTLFDKDPDLMHACELQAQIIDEQEQLDTYMQQPKEKRKNEFIRFGKRKNEFIRFGRSGEMAHAADEEMPMTKRKNEFIRFGKRKNEFIRFGKRKNEFIRFGRNAPEEHKRKNEFIRFGKRKNEFIRFG